jgi:predicted dithiol-disulfide oxidoreductase (DUF899 family)
MFRRRTRQPDARYNYTEGEFQIDELPGTSVFFRDEVGTVFHTYSSYARGNEQLIGTYNYLDMAPKGRNETGPSHNLNDWVRHHDRYGSPASCCHGD